MQTIAPLPNPSKAEINGAINAIIAVMEAIREAGSIPCGTLYAGLMTKGCTLANYESIERTILNTGMVTKSGDVLSWKGGAA